MNQFIFMGRATREPEIKYTNDEKAVAKFAVAVDRKFRKDVTDFFDCTAFGKTAEFIERYVKTGTKIIVTGSVQNNNYVNRDGKKIRAITFLVEHVEFAESKKAQEEKREAPKEEWANIPEGADEELPFV